MLNKRPYLVFIFLVSVLFSTAQEKENDSTSIGLDKELVVVEDLSIERKPIDPLRPSKAAFIQQFYQVQDKPTIKNTGSFRLFGVLLVLEYTFM